MTAIKMLEVKVDDHDYKFLGSIPLELKKLLLNASVGLPQNQLGAEAHFMAILVNPKSRLTFNRMQRLMVGHKTNLNSLSRFENQRTNHERQYKFKNSIQGRNFKIKTF